MRFIYEILIIFDSDTYQMKVPDLPGCFAWADTVEGVLSKAPDALETHVGSYLAEGKRAPSATFGHVAGDGEILALVSFDASAASVGAPHLAAKYAAERLGISKGRVSQLLKDGRLEGYRHGRNVMVSEASIERFASERRSAGRPRKSAVVA